MYGVLRSRQRYQVAYCAVETRSVQPRRSKSDFINENERVDQVQNRCIFAVMEIPRPTALSLHTEKVGEEGGEAGMPAATAAVDMSKAGKGGLRDAKVESGILPFTVYPSQAGRQSGGFSPRVQVSASQTADQIKPWRHHASYGKSQTSASSPLGVDRQPRKRSPKFKGKIAGAVARWCRGGFHIRAYVRWERRDATGYRQITKRPEGSLFPTVADWDPVVPGP